MQIRMKDPIVESVVKKYEERSKVGIHKYGTTLQDNELSLLEWLTHLQLSPPYLKKQKRKR